MPGIPSRFRPTARFLAVHVALLVAIWLASIALYALVLEQTDQLGWVAVDVALVAGCVAVVYVLRDTLGFGSLGSHKHAKLAAIVVLAIVCVLFCQLAIEDWDMVSLDESHYLATVRAGHILSHGRIPYNMRWLVPMLAGAWNFFPVSDAAALKALNFGGFVVTAVMLVLLLVRLRVPLWLAMVAPVFLLSSYLGVYGAHNRLVLDPTTYAMFALVFHTLVRREHWYYFPIVVLVAACNAEKAVYWLPVFPLVELMRAPRPWTARAIIDIAKRTVIAIAPALVYMTVLYLYLRGSSLEANLCFENLYLMSFTTLGTTITNQNVIGNSFQNLWFPFGAFTVYALLGFQYAERWMRPVALLLLPIFVQNVIACDADRMVAYTFIVYLPFGFMYLKRFVEDVPRPLALPLVAIAAAGAVAVTASKFNLIKKLMHPGSRMIISTAEIAIAGCFLIVHFMFFYDPQRSVRGDD